MHHRVPELLAPAGSLDAVRAALANGANAVYLGAERFNARDDGAQLTLDEVRQACTLAHAHGARIYLTFNILFKPSELHDALIHLGECIDRGIDAAIVQDLGAIRLIEKLYPDLEIHGSTQMTVHDPTGARVLEQLGVDRVVLARENTLDDIRAIRAAVPDLGLESFIHGALCIAYSGQCFMSGMISERSANRGACAQSCRKDYLLTDSITGEELDRGYLISAKDLAAAEHLEAIAEVGIGCLKIEGRKKKPEYVATVTRTYRGFLDRLEQGEWHPPSERDMQPLVQIFSRGFTGGMYGGRAGRDYITRLQPDNRGAELGRVVGHEGTELIISVTQPVAVGDGLGFEHPDGASSGNTGFTVSQVRDLGRRNGRLQQAINAGAPVPANWVVVRSAQASLLAESRASFAGLYKESAPPRIPLSFRLAGSIGTSLRLTATAGSDSVTLESTVLLATADKHGLDEAKLREQLGRLGETVFELASLDTSGLGDSGARALGRLGASSYGAELGASALGRLGASSGGSELGASAPGRLGASSYGSDLFLPVSQLNDLRQRAVAELMEHRDRAEQARKAERQASVDAVIREMTVFAAEAPTHARSVHAPKRPSAHLIAETFTLSDAREAALAGADEISLDLFLRHPTPPVSRVRALIEELGSMDVTVRLRTPTIVRPEERKVLDKWLALSTPLVSGHLGLVAELAGAGRSVVADYAVNCFNQVSAAEIFGLGAERIVLSVELTSDEMAEVAAPWNGAGFDVFAYGRPEGMTLEHCVLSAAFDREVATCRDLCVQKHANVELTDPAGYVFPVATDSACRNRLLHSRPVDGSEYLPSLWRHGFRNFKLVFNVPGDPVAEVTRAYRGLLDALNASRVADHSIMRRITGREYTRGHFARAV